MGRNRTTECSKGHKRTPENTRIARDGSQTCKICDKERQRERQSRLTRKAGMADTAELVARDAIDIAEELLAELKAQYDQDPRNYALAEEHGRQLNRVLSMRRARASKPAPAGYERVAPIDAVEFYAALPTHCPACGRHLAGGGHISRIGDRGWSCRRGTSVEPCDYQGRIEER